MSGEETESSNDRSSQTARIRQLSTWMLGAFGGIGTLLIGGVSITALTDPDLEPENIGLAIGGLAVALVGVAAAIMATLSVLRSGALALDELPSKGALRTDLEARRGLLLGRWSNYGEFAQDFARGQQQRDTLWATYLAAERERLDDPSDSAKATAAVAAAEHYQLSDQDAKTLEARAETIIGYATNRAVRFSLGRARWWLLVAGALVAGGVVAFTLGTRDDRDGEQIKTLTVVVLDLTDRGANEYVTALTDGGLDQATADRCAAALNLPLEGTAVAGRLDRPVVAIPRHDDCPPAQIRLGDDFGTIAPLAEETPTAEEKSNPRCDCDESDARDEDGGGPLPEAD